MEGQWGQHQHSQDPPTDTPISYRIATDPQGRDDGQPGGQDLTCGAEASSPGSFAFRGTQPSVNLQHVRQDRALGAVGHQVRGAMG